MHRIQDEVAVVVEKVVGQFELLEHDGLLHPVCPRRGRVWMNVEATVSVELASTKRIPFVVFVFVAVVLFNKRVGIV